MCESPEILIVNIENREFFFFTKVGTGEERMEEDPGGPIINEGSGTCF